MDTKLCTVVNPQQPTQERILDNEVLCSNSDSKSSTQGQKLPSKTEAVEQDDYLETSDTLIAGPTPFKREEQCLPRKKSRLAFSFSLYFSDT